MLPFPVPSFDIEQYLLQSNFEYSFEVNSDDSSESIKANFDRMLQKEAYENKMWHLIYKKAYKPYINIKTAPYRKGSKALSTSEILIKSNNGSTINLVDILNDFETEISSVVND